MSKNLLLIINDAPYGNERPYNGFRLALTLLKHPNLALRVFLLGDGVQCAVIGQQVPQGSYNVESMIGSVVRRGAVAT
jgi:uncharacterized protein involved in oxidation of intracellular sulfur